MTYEEKCTALGIKRPESLSDKFPAAHPTLTTGKNYWNGKGLKARRSRLKAKAREEAQTNQPTTK